jgi:hypothetical protein
MNWLRRSLQSWKIVAVLEEDFGLNPVWDRHIHPGMPFTDAIREMIASAHLFIPLLTGNSKERPWVHQETGYAMALNVPILPIATAGCLPEELAAQLQAIEITDAENLRQQLQEVDFERIIFPSRTRLQNISQEAFWPEERTELLARYADLAVELARGEYSFLRQSGALSSFCIPDRDLDDSIWKERDGNQLRSDYYHSLQREERLALERHARASGCKLIIFPSIEFTKLGPCVKRTRLSTLIEFLEKMPDDKVEVAISDFDTKGNLTIIGDWFLAESMLPGPGGYRQTIFKWHAPTVFEQIRQFDQQFAALREQRPWSRSEVIERLRTNWLPSPCDP